MTGTTRLPRITIDLTQFKLHLGLAPTRELTLHFNSPSRRFYLAVIALVVTEMKRQGKITSIPLRNHHDLLALLNETIGGSTGSSAPETLLARIYKKWQHALPNLEEAPLFLVLGRKKDYAQGSGRTYAVTEAEKDGWANLFEYKGSHENVRLKFALDRIGATVDDVVLRYEDAVDAEAWERFISRLKEKGKEGEEEQAAPDHRVADVPAVPAPSGGERGLPVHGSYRRVPLMAAIVGVLGTIALTIALTIGKASVKPAPGHVAAPEKMTFPLPEKPSIAVLPFLNLSGDPQQAFLSDGMTAELITALAKVPRLVVIGGYLTAPYRGNPGQVKQISEELGARYVLGGSVQRSGDRVRITAQLIDALTGTHLWANQYERELPDSFAVQDEVTINILSNLQATLLFGGRGMSARFAKYFSGKHGLDCYVKFMEAEGHYLRWNIEDNTRARRITEEAIALCPENPKGYEVLGWVYHHAYWLGDTTAPRVTFEKSLDLAQRALTMDNSMHSAHCLLSNLYAMQGDQARAIGEGERAVALNPGDAYAVSDFAWSLNLAGRSEDAIPVFQKAIRLTHVGPFSLYRGYGLALRRTGRFAEAVSAYQKAIQIVPESGTAHLGLAATYGLMGREWEARDEAAQVLRINPKFSLDYFAKLPGFQNQSERDKVVGVLRQAGLK